MCRGSLILLTNSPLYLAMEAVGQSLIACMLKRLLGACYM